MLASKRSGNDNVARMLWDAADRDAGKAAVIERDVSIDYGQLRSRSAAIAEVLVAGGVRPGDRVVVLLERGADAVAAYFGVVATGALAIVLNELLRPRQVEYVLAQSEARALVTSSAVRSRVHRDVETTAAVVLLDDVEREGVYDPVERSSDDAVQITYTSGSTGLPKGVVASHGNVWSVIETVVAYQGIEGSDRIAGLLPISGVYGANQMLCAALTGATLVIPTSPVMNDVAEELKRHEVSVLAAVPPLWLQLLQAPAFAASPIASLRILQNAGGHLPPAAVRSLRGAQPHARLFLQYGMTEVFRSTFLMPEEVDTRPDCMGRPIPGAEIHVLREDGTPCDPGEVGELVHAGPTVTLGYWNDPDRTAAVYREHDWIGPQRRVVHSGDMVRRDADGYLYFVGRQDRMIKTLGYRVGPDEILDAMYASGQIREGVITAEPDPIRGQKVVAFVALADGGTVAALQKYCRVELPRYMQPAVIHVLDALPKLPNGKHDVMALINRPDSARPAASG